MRVQRAAKTPASMRTHFRWTRLDVPHNAQWGRRITTTYMVSGLKASSSSAQASQLAQRVLANTYDEAGLRRRQCTEQCGQVLDRFTGAAASTTSPTTRYHGPPEVDRRHVLHLSTPRAAVEGAPKLRLSCSQSQALTLIRRPSISGNPNLDPSSPLFAWRRPWQAWHMRECVT